jgi:hypothetical protein
MSGMPRIGRVPALMLVIAATSMSLPLLLDVAHSAEVSTSQESTTKNARDDSRQGLATVTVEATRERELKRQISHFVSSFDVTYLHDSLQRWNTPICPLVAGLSSEAGEFILARLSQVARDAHAPLGPEHCRPNLYIVVTSDPDLLVEKWVKRDRRSFNTCSGFGYIRDFLHSRRPIRVLYNAALRSSDGANRDVGALYVQSWSLDFSLNSCTSAGVAGTRLSYGAIQALSSVVIVADSARITRLNMGQLADYVSMIGLAEIRLDADTGTAPSILGLFREPDSPPQGLSLWDQSFLDGLYSTDQSSVLEVNAIKAHMLQEITGH